MDTELDDSWIQTFETTDDIYKHFYKDDIWYTNLQYIYVNRENEIQCVKTEPFLMEKPNHISRDGILHILKKCSVMNNRNYSLLSIIKYNITLDVDDVEKFLHSETADSYEYLNIVKNIDNVIFGKTITMFQDLNDLVFIFYEKPYELKNTNPNNTTKRIHFGKSGSKKSKRNLYKD